MVEKDLRFDVAETQLDVVFGMVAVGLCGVRVNSLMSFVQPRTLDLGLPKGRRRDGLNYPHFTLISTL
jgi:hypothetical protein